MGITNILILINIAISIIVAVLVIFIIYNQKRKKILEKEKIETENRLNFKNEVLIRDLHNKLDELIKNQEDLTNRVSNLETTTYKRQKSSDGKKYKFIDVNRKK